MARRVNRLGNRRVNVLFLRRIISQAANGEAIETFDPSGSGWAAIHTRSSREIDQSGRFQLEEEQFEFHFRFSTAVRDLTGGDRMKAHGLTFECAGPPIFVEGRAKDVIVPARRVKPTTAV